jgi:aspartyl-tRNA(Asn)/glutamyl-tRNA(Gln) amidotransferase subunit A
LRIGVPRSLFFDDLDTEVANAVSAAIDILRVHAESVQDVRLPSGPELISIMGPEAHAYHARWLAESPQKYQPATRERLVQLSALTSKEDYATARHACDLLRREIRGMFADVDVLVMPTVPDLPSLIEPIDASQALDPSRTRNTGPFDVSGLPAITVPCGFSKSGLPMGLQIVGAPFAESTVLGLAHAYEQVTEWHRRAPLLRS